MLLCNSFEAQNSRFTLEKLKGKFLHSEHSSFPDLHEKYQYRNYSDNHLLVNHRRDTVSWPIHVNWSRHRPIFFMEINRFAVKEPRHLSPSFSPGLIPEKQEERGWRGRTRRESRRKKREKGSSAYDSKRELYN